jgi:DNA invertase Pin-like site-specific DNA recombinase
MDYARQRGWDVEVTVISDRDQLLRLAAAGQASVVLCSSLGDLADSLPGLLRVLRDFASHKTTLIVPNANIDTSKVALPELLDAIETLKHETAREATVLGLAAAVKRGARLGRPRTLNPHQAEIAALRSQGMSGRAIAKRLSLSPSSVFKAFRSAGK